MRGLLVQLGALDDILDSLLLASSLLIVAPPHWSLVFARKAQMSASFATRLALIALFPSQSACEAACTRPSVHLRGRLFRR